MRAEEQADLYRAEKGRDPPPPPDHQLAWQWDWRGTPEEREALRAGLLGGEELEQEALA